MLGIVKNEELEHPTPRSLERVPYKGIQQSDDEPSGSPSPTFMCALQES